MTKAERERVHEEVRLLAEIQEAISRGHVEQVIRLADVLGWVHYGPNE